MKCQDQWKTVLSVKRTRRSALAAFGTCGAFERGSLFSATRRLLCLRSWSPELLRLPCFGWEDKEGGGAIDSIVEAGGGDWGSVREVGEEIDSGGEALRYSMAGEGFQGGSGNDEGRETWGDWAAASQ